MPEPEAEAPSSTERHLREKAKMTDRQLSEAKREIAVLRSKVDTGTKLGQLFLKSYDGDYTPDAIRSAADEYGIPRIGQGEE